MIEGDTVEVRVIGKGKIPGDGIARPDNDRAVIVSGGEVGKTYIVRIIQVRESYARAVRLWEKVEESGIEKILKRGGSE